MKTFGLIGNNLSHSFSKKFFRKKILLEGIKETEYLNFEIDDISNLRNLINKKNILGLNITIPFKERVIPFLDEIKDDAKNIGAVNTIKIIKKKIIGYNTDFIGFKESIRPIIKNKKTALILGNGGAAKAVRYALDKLQIKHKTITRNSENDYNNISQKDMKYYKIIINTTPLGMHPNKDSFPKIPYKLLNKEHLLYDLVYNPSKSIFLNKGEKYNCTIKNGVEMLQIQANHSWKIWHS